MSRTGLLAAYDKLSVLLGKLPGSLQGPVLRELEPIKEIFLEQRAPRLAVLGDPTIGLPELLNGLAGRPVLHAPLPRGVWTGIAGDGVTAWTDLRSPGPAPSDAPDLYLYLGGGGGGGAAAERAAEVMAASSSAEGVSPPGMAVLVLGTAEDSAAVMAGLAGAGASGAVVFSTELPKAGLNARERSDLGDKLCLYLPPQAQLEMARFLGAREAQAHLAGTVLKSFGAVAGVIGMQPIPLADFPVLLALQMFMVSLIIYVSGRAFSLKLAGEFVASLGIGFGAGLAFRETARAAAKFLPVWGHVISGGVAGAGTYALGRAAIAYYIERRRPRRLPLWMRRAPEHFLPPA